MTWVAIGLFTNAATFLFLARTTYTQRDIGRTLDRVSGTTHSYRGAAVMLVLLPVMAGVALFLGVISAVTA